MVVLDSKQVDCIAERAFFGFSVFEAYLSDVLAAAGNLDADNFAVVNNIDPVVSFVIFNLMHGDITSLKIVVR
ncbi:MAG: hypothetical protein RJR37_09050 [Peptococcaceae bacterium MAG4]|jgi:hypothetical protein|nr:hypothetical protein [Peptococcaceae bacterium MAG4]